MCRKFRRRDNSHCRMLRRLFALRLSAKHAERTRPGIAEDHEISEAGAPDLLRSLKSGFADRRTLPAFGFLPALLAEHPRDRLEVI
jgi:hypothetical protein